MRLASIPVASCEAVAVPCSGSISMRPKLWNFVPVWVMMTVWPSLFSAVCTYCSWLWPSMTMSIPLVFATTVSLRHCWGMPVWPRCASSTT